MKKSLRLLTVGLSALLIASCGGKTSSSLPEKSSEPDSSSTPSSVSSEDLGPKGYDDDKVHLIILAGQSGARGKAVNTDLTPEQKVPSTEVDIIADGYTMPTLSNIPTTISNGAMFKPLAPGFGDSGGEFGPELGMGETMASRYPKDGESRRSAIVKFTACGSTFIADWFSESAVEDEDLHGKLNLKQAREMDNGRTTGPLTNNLYQLIDRAISDLDDEGYEAVIDGIVFSHGEQDTKFDENMEIYEQCLKYLIKDVRAYVGNEHLPFVVTESLTNAGKYTNKLREIQKRVAEADEDAIFLNNEGLLPNTFEPWHLGAESNFILGNRAAEAIIRLNDTRVVDELPDMEYNVAVGQKPVMDKYVKALFESGYEGYTQVTFDEFDYNTTGDYNIKYHTLINQKKAEGNATVHVGNYAVLDGKFDEGFYKETESPDKLFKVYLAQTETGLSFGVHIDDNDICTDGEKWSSGDMGQRKQNDDFRFYITDGSATDRYTIALSSANLLRVYDSSVSIETSLDTQLSPRNLVFKKGISNWARVVHTHGDVNGGTNDGLDMEMFIPFEDLEYDDESELSVMFAYSDMKFSVNARQETMHYFVDEGCTSTEEFEDADDAYMSISNFLK